jgi:hypothetical protein
VWLCLLLSINWRYLTRVCFSCAQWYVILSCFLQKLWKWKK